MEKYEYTLDHGTRRKQHATVLYAKYRPSIFYHSLMRVEIDNNSTIIISILTLVLQSSWQ